MVQRYLVVVQSKVYIIPVLVASTLPIIAEDLSQFCAKSSRTGTGTLVTCYNAESADNRYNVLVIVLLYL